MRSSGTVGCQAVTSLLVIITSVLCYWVVHIHEAHVLRVECIV